MPSLQDLEDSSEDEYDTIQEPSQAIHLQDSNTKPTELYSGTPLLPTPAITISPDPNTHSERDQASSTTLSRSPTPDFETPSQESRKRKRRDTTDSNAAQNRELIDSNLRRTILVNKPAGRPKAPRSAGWLVDKYGTA
jgi:hypothetical protein